MHNDEDLRSMARHVWYELDEFRKSAAAITAGKRDENWNRTLESALLHFRNLRGFFVDPHQADDASAQDYVPSWTPTADPVFSETREPLNKALAHLTWSRLKVGQIDWPINRMALAIDKLFGEFKQSMTVAQAEWFSANAVTVTWGLGNAYANSTMSWGR
jgi:hypothetical protein